MTALDFLLLGDKLSASYEAAHGFLLGLKAEAAFSLTLVETRK